MKEGVEGKVIRENKPVLLVLSVCDGEIILEKGEILSEKCQRSQQLHAMSTPDLRIDVGGIALALVTSRKNASIFPAGKKATRIRPRPSPTKAQT